MTYVCPTVNWIDTLKLNIIAGTNTVLVLVVQEHQYTIQCSIKVYICMYVCICVFLWCVEEEKDTGDDRCEEVAMVK